MRPRNLLMAATGAVVGALSGGAPLEQTTNLLVLAAAAFVAVAGTAGGNLLNDLRDQGLDRTAHPERPIARGLLRPGIAWPATVVLFLLAVAVAALFDPIAGLLALALVGLLVLYEFHLKQNGLPGNIAVAVAAGALFPLGALVADARLAAPLLLGALAGLAHLGRELLKDLEDAKADRDHRRTFAHTNAPLASGIASVAFVTAAALSPLPYLLLSWHWLYLIVVGPAALLLIGAGLIGSRRPGHGQQLAKLAMVVALVAFLLGARV